jgi:hypothetical protein
VVGCFSYKEEIPQGEQFSKEKIFMNMEIATNFEVVKFIETHNQFIG